MGDTLDYIDGECEEWAEYIDMLLIEGRSWDEALEEGGMPPLPDCIEYISQKPKR